MVHKDVIKDVISRLEGIGYIVVLQELDVGAAVLRAAEKIKANINRKDIPRGLYLTWVDMAAGFFLSEKKALGQLPAELFDMTAPAKKITEGDVTVEFSGVSEGCAAPEARLDALIDGWVNPPSWIFAAYRKVRW